MMFFFLWNWWVWRSRPQSKKSGLTRGKIKYAWWTPDRNKQCKSTLLTTQTWRAAAVSPQRNSRKLKTNTVWKLLRYRCRLLHGTALPPTRSPALQPAQRHRGNDSFCHPARWPCAAGEKLQRQRTRLLFPHCKLPLPMCDFSIDP